MNAWLPKLRSQTQGTTDQTISVAHGVHSATQITGSEKCYIRTIVWTRVAVGSDQKPKSGHRLDNGRTKVTLDNNLIRDQKRSIVWIMVAR